MGSWEVREVGRPDVSLEAPRVVLRWGVLLPEVLMMVRRVGQMEALRMVRRVGLMEALRVGLIVVRGEIEQGAPSVGRNAFPGGRVEGLLSCS